MLLICCCIIDYLRSSISTFCPFLHTSPDILHIWSPLSNTLAGVVFQPKLEGDNNSPCQQSALTSDQLKQKEFAVFDQALKELNLYWENSYFDGFKISLKIINCGEDILKWSDFERMKGYLKAPARDLHNFSSFTNERKCMLKHLDRHLNELCFMRCNDRSCCSVLRSEPLQEYI